MNRISDYSRRQIDFPMKTPAVPLTVTSPNILSAQGWTQRLCRVLSVAALLVVGAGGVRAQSGYPGSVDPSFNTGSGPNGPVLALASQSDGKTIIGGTFTTVNGTARNGVARLNTDGSLDTTFSPGTGSNGQVDSVTVLSTGTILVAGTFTTFNGAAHPGIVRLTSTGSVDTTFVPALNSTTALDITAVIVQSDGKLVLPGAFSATGNYLLVRLGVNGAVDTTFNFGTGANGAISALALQSDGKILVGGSFSSINGVAASAIARINTNGSLDTTFNTGVGANGSVLAIAVQNDGEVVIGGTFSEVGGSTRYGIARLTATGGLDSTFDPISDDYASINAIAIEPSGNIIFGGNFYDFDDYYTPDLVRVLPNGTFDFNFYVGDGPSNTVDAIIFSPSGGLLIGGIFTEVNDEPLNFVAQLLDDTHPAFFDGEISLGNGVYYLSFYNGNSFGEYSYLTNSSYIYSYGLFSYEYLIDANDGADGIYLYDFTSDTFFYTSPYFPYPYLYDFSLNSVVYYLNNGTTPRYFYDYATSQFITK